MSRVAIVAALEREVRPLIKGWRVSEKEYGGRRFRFFEKDDAVVVCGGIGPQAARRAAEAIIVLYQPGVLYSVGYAGALEPGRRVGTLIKPSVVVNAADGSRVQLDHGEGTLVTFGMTASLAAQKAGLRRAFGAQAVDMEAAEVSRAAELRAVKFGAIKAISDEFDFEFPRPERFLTPDGRLREVRFIFYVTVRPWLWPKVLRLARNSRVATQALCEELRKSLRN